MIMRLKKIFLAFLSRPKWIFVLCCIALFWSIISDLSFFQLLNAKKQLVVLQQSIQQAKEQKVELESELSKINKPEYIEKEIIERLEYVGENDLIFIFK